MENAVVGRYGGCFEEDNWLMCRRTRGSSLMHLKCIHELCTITLVFHSYLHHIRGILLLFNDFW